MKLLLIRILPDTFKYFSNIFASPGGVERIIWIGSGSYPLSPTSVSSFSANSPVLPTPRDFDNRAAGAVNWEPSWLPDQTEQHSAATLSTDVASIPVFDQGCISLSYSGYPPQQSSLMLPATRNNLTSTRDSLLTAMTSEYVEAPEIPSPIDDRDKPFILCPEYEAAATARFNAIFQTSPQNPNIPNLSSMNQYPDLGSINLYTSGKYTTTCCIITVSFRKLLLSSRSSANPCSTYANSCVPKDSRRPR